MAGRRYEENYLFLLISSILGQKELPATFRSPDWGVIFQLADYHDIAPLVYLGILGQEGIGKDTRERFFEKYQEAVLYQERYQTEERFVINQMKRMEIPFIILARGWLTNYYLQPEMAGARPLELLVEPADFTEACIVLRLMDYDEKTKPYERMYLKRFHKPAGTDVVIYKKLPFYSKRIRWFYQRRFKRMMRSAAITGSYAVGLDGNETFAFMVASMVNRYAAGEMTLRDMIDLWVLSHQEEDSLSWSYIQRVLNKNGILEFSGKLLDLADMLFDGKLNFADEETYKAMEAYIMTKGLEGRSVSEKLLPLTKVAADNYRRDRRQEQRRETFQWMFPSRDYMKSMYPTLENYAFLLPFFWILRLLRRKAKIN